MADFTTEADLVIDELYGESRPVFIDPMTIAMIASILGAIFNAIRLWCQIRQQRKSKDIAGDIKNEAQNQTVRAKISVRRHVRHYMSKEDFKERGDEIIAAILRTGGKATPEYIESLLNRTEV